MRMFYVKDMKRYLLVGAGVAFLLGLVLRVFYAPFSIQELTIHMRFRSLLGHPTSYYSYLSLFTLSVVYQVIYIYLGAFIGYLTFKAFHRKGYTLLFLPRFKWFSGASALVVLYLFISVDMVNPYQGQVAALSEKIKIPAKFVSSMKYLFLPSMIKIEPFRPTIETNNRARTTTGSTQNSSQRIYPSPQKRSQALAGGGNAIFQPGTNQSQTPQSQSQPAPQQAVTALALLNSLNAYRGEKGLHSLTMDAKLNDYAMERARHFTSIGHTDTTGFQQLRASGGVYKMGFRMLGENSSYGATFMSPDEIIRNHFGKYPANNEQQLNSSWHYVGIGVDGQSIDIVFAGIRCDSPYCN